MRIVDFTAFLFLIPSFRTPTLAKGRMSLGDSKIGEVAFDEGLLSCSGSFDEVGLSLGDSEIGEIGFADRLLSCSDLFD